MRAIRETNTERSTAPRRAVGIAVLVIMSLMVGGSRGLTRGAGNALTQTRMSYTRFLLERGAVITPSPEAVLQHALNDCGLAVLEVVLRGHPARRVPVRDSLARLVGLTARGTTLTRLGATLSALGVHHRRVTRGDQMTGASPFIAHMTYRHFVLVRSFGEQSVRLFDPLVGEVMMDTHQFTTLWSGGGLQLLPSATPMTTTTPRGG